MIRLEDWYKENISQGNTRFSAGIYKILDPNYYYEKLPVKCQEAKTTRVVRTRKAITCGKDRLQGVERNSDFDILFWQ